MDDTLMIQMLVVAGFSEEQAKKMREELNKKVNAAIIDAVLVALTLDERQVLKAALMQEPKTLESITQRLLRACESSVNKPDSYKLFVQTKARLFDEFWANLDRGLTDEQRQKLADFIQKTLNENPEFRKTNEAYQKIRTAQGA